MQNGAPGNPGAPFCAGFRLVGRPPAVTFDCILGAVAQLGGHLFASPSKTTGVDKLSVIQRESSQSARGSFRVFAPSACPTLHTSLHTLRTPPQGETGRGWKAWIPGRELRSRKTSSWSGPARQNRNSNFRNIGVQSGAGKWSGNRRGAPSEGAESASARRTPGAEGSAVSVTDQENGDL
jgi:hypothetical protein